jgi:AraC family transcriptional regulator, regulatory protein of adaptative response / DNA-3-methyladenine glycosylase II
MSENRQWSGSAAGRLDHVILPDADTCYRAVSSRDPRFDGWFFTAVRTTGIYCRPSCPALTPRRHNVTFYPSAAAAQRAGYRACKRCRPDASPGSPEWDVRGDLAGRALRLIADGIVDREGVPGLARRLGYSERQLNRTLLAEVGAGPLSLARAQRAQTARVLLETTDLPSADVAFAAGFASVRQFNDTVQRVFATTPSGLRARVRRVDSAGASVLTLRLPYRAPMDLDRTLGFLAARAVDGLEDVTLGADGQVSAYARALHAPHGPALVTVSPTKSAVSCAVELTDHRDLVAVVSRVRRLLDLDADPVAVDAAFAAEPALRPLVEARPGLRSPGTVDGFELAVRALVGQQISVTGAATVLGRIAAEHGSSITLGGRDWRLFPTAKALAAADPATLPMPRARGRAVVALAAAVDAGEIDLDPSADRVATRAALLALPGVGRWTADYIAMRALADPDVLMSADLGARRAAAALGIDIAGGRADWAPWRSYATHHLWASLAPPVAVPPVSTPSTIKEDTR